MAEGLLVDGVTDAGVSVFLSHDSGHPYNGDFIARIGGEAFQVVGVGRLRDGGTTTYILQNDAGDEHKIVLSRRIGSDDRTPRLDGEKVSGSGEGEAE